jgi:hypothetical protein
MYRARAPQIFGTVRPQQPSLPLDHVFTVGRPSDGEIRRLPQEERIGGLTVLPRTERPETQAEPAK